MIRTFCVNYCDDIRHEVGGKTSVIGIYGDSLLVPEIPTIIPKLCIFCQVYSELSKAFDTELEFRVLLDDETITNWISTPEKKVVRPKQFQKIVAQFVISPFLIEKESILRVRAYYKDSEYKAAGLKIKANKKEINSETSELAP